MTRNSKAIFFTGVSTLLLTACGGGGSGEQVASTPAPVSAPSAESPSTPVATPAAPDVDYDTAEYRASSGPSFHDAIAAYAAGANGAGIMVGIVDSGITDAAGEFAGRISTLSRDFAGNGTYDDVGGHGTAVAEALAGARNGAHVQGMAWGATVLALRTDKPGTCGGSGCEHPSSAMAQAVDYAWRNGARVINISLGGEINSAELLAAVGRATTAGTIIVVAAGNAKAGEAPSAAPNLLASSIANPQYGHGLVIVANSVGTNGLISSFSNGARGFETRTLGALGDAVQTIDNKGTDLLYTGTSFSAPQIAGAAALLAQAFPNLTSAQIVQLLLNTARDAGATGPDAIYGMGIMDVANAFAPQGRLSLAGSPAPLSASGPSLLSAAMGDATPAGLAAIILDSYRRPFRTDLASGMARPGLRRRLTAALEGQSRQVQGMAGPLSLSLKLLARPQRLRRAAQPNLWGSDARQINLVSGTVGTRLSPRATVAMGMRSGLKDLSQLLDGRARPAFLVADEGAGAATPELRAESSLAWRQGLGRGFALVSGFEMGSIDGEAGRPGLLESPVAGRAAHYQAMLSALSFDRGRLGFTAGVRLVDEAGSMLGARFAPALGRAIGAQHVRVHQSPVRAGRRADVRCRHAARLDLCGRERRARPGRDAQIAQLVARSHAAQPVRRGRCLRASRGRAAARDRRPLRTQPAAGLGLAERDRDHGAHAAGAGAARLRARL